MTGAIVYRVVVEVGDTTTNLLLAASGPHQLSALLREYSLASRVVGIVRMGTLVNVRLAEADARDLRPPERH